MMLVAGGYTGDAHGSVKLFGLDGEGKQTYSASFDAVRSPTFLAYQNGMLYCAGERDGKGCIASMRCNGQALEMSFVRMLPENRLSHISVCGGIAAGADYMGGSVYFLALDPRKDVGRLLFTENYASEGEISHPHCVVFSPDGRFAYTCDLGRDRLICYSVSDGIRTVGETKLLRGDGPRHILFHPSANTAYIITEYSNVVYTLKYNPETGAMLILQRLSTLPDGYDKESLGASLCFSSEKNVLYASNRGKNSIAVFDADKNGILVYRGEFPCGGDWPRHIALSKNERFIFCANQCSGHISVLPLSENGDILPAAAQLSVTDASFAAEILAEG